MAAAARRATPPGDLPVSKVGSDRHQSFNVAEGWLPLATSPEALDARHRRTVHASRLDGSRVILEGATLSGDALRGATRVGRGPVGYVAQLVLDLCHPQAIDD